jgi:tellurite resistance protein
MESTEAKVQGAMGLMEPGYLEEDSPGAEAMRRLLFAAGAVVAGADGEVSALEIAALASLLGEGRVPRTLNPERLAEVMPERIKRVIDLVSEPKRVQLIRDLTLIAKADGGVDNRERFVIRELAGKLGVQPSFCDMAIEDSSTLD